VSFADGGALAAGGADLFVVDADPDAEAPLPLPADRRPGGGPGVPAGLPPAVIFERVFCCRGRAHAFAEGVNPFPPLDAGPDAGADAGAGLSIKRDMAQH
jgi:hypothetical protein